MKSFTRNKLSIFELCIFAMFGALMFASKIALEFLPNIHLLAMFTVLLTVVYRTKALIPIYVYVIIQGVYAGFNVWWIPYLYIWTVLWGVTMLLPKKMSKTAQAIVYPIVCGAHGILFGALYAPAQAIMFKMSFKMMVSWIIAGLPYDALHCAGDVAAGCLVLPLSILVKKLDKRYNKQGCK